MADQAQPPAAPVQPGQKITPEQVRHVAKLARLALDEGQVAALTSELESILEYVAKVQAIDTTGAEPMAHALALHNVLRDDTPGEPLPVEKVLQNAPETDGPFFKVPKVLGGDEDSAG